MGRDLMLSLFEASRSLPLYVLGTAALTVLISALYDSVRSSYGLTGTWVLVLALIAIVLAVLFASSLRRRIVGRLIVNDARMPGPRAGLVLLVSPQIGTARAAIDYHLPALKTLWLVASPDSFPSAQLLQSEYAARIPDVRLGADYIVDPEVAGATFDVVTRILEMEAEAAGIALEALIADITGGLKPMTAGMTLACVTASSDMQYMKAKRGADGAPDRSIPAEPIRIDLALGIDRRPETL